MHANLKSVPFFGWVSLGLVVVFWTAMVLAMARPQLPETHEKQTLETRDFIITVDISGSMGSTLSDPNQQNFAGDGSQVGAQPDPSGTPTPATRRAAAAKAIVLFVQQRQGDRVGLLLFDTSVYYAWPLTSDIQMIIKKAPLATTSGGGTNFDGPSPSNTDTGAIQGSINAFRQMSKANTKVLILITDGEDAINDQRFQELAAQIKDLGIHVYVLGVGEGWVNGTPDLQKFVESVGGKVMVVGNTQQMQDGMNAINQLEKSKITVEKTQSNRDIYHWFLYAAIAAFLLYFLTALIVREDV